MTVDSWRDRNRQLLSRCVRPTTFLLRLLPLYICLSFYSRWTSISSSSFHENKSTHTHTHTNSMVCDGLTGHCYCAAPRSLFGWKLSFVTAVYRGTAPGLVVVQRLQSKVNTHFWWLVFPLVPSCKRSWSNQRQLDLIVVPVRRRAFFYKYGNCRPRSCCFQWAHLMCTPIILYHGNW